MGDFIGGNKQQILSANGSRLSISEATRRQNGFREIFSQDASGIIRHIAKFRLTGGDKDTLRAYALPQPAHRQSENAAGMVE